MNTFKSTDLSIAQQEMQDAIDGDIDRLYEAIINEEYDFESFDLPHFFKRLNFVKVDSDKITISKEDFYGNINVFTKHPKTLAWFSLNVIWASIKLGYDRYSIIIAIKNLLKNDMTEIDFIDNLFQLYKLNEKELNYD